jgi:hypothetical protein
MNTQARRSGAMTPAYYLGRPAAFWSVALAPRHTRASIAGITKLCELLPVALVGVAGSGSPPAAD